MECQTCRFWVPLQHDGLGECHRYPPTPPRGPDDVGVPGVMPITDRTDWCGEWARDVKGTNGV